MRGLGDEQHTADETREHPNTPTHLTILTMAEMAFSVASTLPMLRELGSLIMASSTGRACCSTGMYGGPPKVAITPTP